MSGTATARIAGVTRLKLWFVLLGGAIAWAVHLGGAYAIAEFGCVAGWGHAPGSVSAVSWMLIVLSAAMTLLAAGALLASYQVGKRPSHGPAGADADEHDTADYVARFGKITNGLFLFIIVVQSLPIVFYLGRC